MKRGVARLLATGFLTLIVSASVAQVVVDGSFYATAPDAFRDTPAGTRQRSPWSALEALISRNRSLLASINRLDDLIVDDSFVATTVRRPVQYLLTTRLGVGTAQVYPGTDGWLFYGPDVAYVTGNGFLSPTRLARRSSGGDTLTVAPQSDPKPAILALHEQLARRGIDLIVMPTAVKPSIHPEWLTSAAGSAAIARNPSYRTFLEELTDRGVMVFDVAAELEAAKGASAEPLYLATDTHWRPEAVELVATALASFIDRRINLSPRPPTSYRIRPANVTGNGDTARLLDLPLTQTAYPAETVTLRQVTSPDGRLWRRDPDADILLLGDSFANVFTLQEMGWGTAAGLAEQLSFALQRPVNRIARNADGAYASREVLATELRRGQDRLAGKRVVIFQFAERELGQGDWRLIDLAVSAPPDLGSFVSPQPGVQLEIRGVVEEIWPVPRPRTVPYTDHIVSVHVTGITINGPAALVDGTEALVYLWSMQDNELTSVASLRAGDPIRFRLEPWTAVADELDGINRGKVGDVTARLAEPWWGQVVEDSP